MKVIALAILSVGLVIDITLSTALYDAKASSHFLENLVSLIAAIMVLFYKEEI